MAKVSVIVPVYNASKYLNQCISSIAEQTMKDIEIITINDGSTDNSLQILEELSLKYKGKIKIFNQDNNGAGAARNVGLENACGEFIKFVDADDYLKLDILDKMYNIAKEYNVSLVRGNYQMVMGPIKLEDKCSFSGIKGNQLIDVKENKDYIVTETPGIGNKLISRDLIGDLRFPEKTKWEDLAIMPVAVASSEKVFHMDENVYNYRINMNTTVKDFIRQIPNIFDIIKCVEIIEEEMKKRGLDSEYSEQIKSLYILHTLFRVENAMWWVRFSHEKKEIVINSLLSILDSKYPDWSCDKILTQYRAQNIFFNYDMNRLCKYMNDDYRNVDRCGAENNIKKLFR